MRRKLSSIASAAFALLVLSVSGLHAQGAYLTSNRLGYTGSVSRFTSLSDAQSNSNAVSGSPFAMPQRDLGLFMVNNNLGFSGAGYPSSAFDFLTNWYSSPITPSNTNDGFVQISDEDAGSVTSVNGAWTNGALTQFQYTVTGANTAAGCGAYTPFIVADCPRLWNAGSALGSGETTLGVYRSYEFSLLASGLSPATFNPVTGVFESVSDPTSVSGYFRGIFQNTSVDDPTSNGYYRVDLSLNLNSWAATQDPQALYYVAVGSSVFGSATVVPEPSTYALMAFGLVGVVIARRRRMIA